MASSWTGSRDCQNPRGVMFLGPYEIVELGVAFYFKAPSHISIPQKSEWHDGQRRLVYGKVY